MGNSSSKTSPAEPAKINLAQFRLLRVVGKGSFGKVRVVEHKETKKTFALKYIRKSDCSKSNSVTNVIRERVILEELEHPLICCLRYAFQDAEYMYMVTDLMIGGDLRFHLNRKAFTEECIKFWIAELCAALFYLHSQGIVHRDVKPDNVLMDEAGHLHLADFNIATHLPTDRPLLSLTGTAAYMAPEIFLGKGYGTAVDWYSLGACFYECIYEKRPFRGRTHEDFANLAINSTPPYYKIAPPMSDECMSALKGFLCKDPENRLGSGGVSQISSHPFLDSFNFTDLAQKRAPPIYSPSKTNNFDTTHELEELLLEQSPLELRARKVARNRDGGTASKRKTQGKSTPSEIQEDERYDMMEKCYEDFDYTKLPRRKLSIAAENLEDLAPPAPLLQPPANISNRISADNLQKSESTGSQIILVLPAGESEPVISTEKDAAPSESGKQSFWKRCVGSAPKPLERGVIGKSGSRLTASSSRRGN
ncbi:Serine/threonine-protein kinase 32A [Neolecta irregularis DAH-3]|uniref:non-specific serine/threonine protein kinase n=1 Tax=Neolecta irregularis (strain DAH-3) TaxID=1198029 RepID=A0A1U7LW05_NEOID|nr:Serine/threonine-protein kinase 32A [Neolecta irregularis DAH-3]|eukprot:OLL26753.1 Serine/threonine-protein kinase 32A [Neolecta irregularis DAH-3]